MKRILILNGHKKLPKELLKYFNKIHITKIIPHKKGLITKLSFNPTSDIGEIAKKIRTADEIWAAGGDGHLNQLFNSLKGYKGKIGILPIGTGNDLARNIGIGTLKHAISLLKGEAKSAVKPIHLMEIELPEFGFKTLFHTVSDVSFGAKINAIVNQSNLFKKTFGKNAYSIAAILGYVTYRNASIDIEIDGNTKKFYRVSVVAALNGKYAGGGLLLSNNSTPHLPDFDMTIGHGLMPSILGWPQILPLLRQMEKGDHALFNKAIITSFSDLKEIKISSLKGLGKYLNTDGEVYESKSLIKKISYSVSKVSYKLIVPELTQY